MSVLDYKELRVWQQSMELVTHVYELMKKMPREELYSLSDQIKRSAVSIPSNIAEGQSRGKKEFLHYLRISQGSLAELETQLMITVDLQFLEKNQVETLLQQITSLRRQLFTLSSRL